MSKRKVNLVEPIKLKEPMFDTTMANCVGTSPDVFFPEGVSHISVTRQAKIVCSGCPLVEKCLDYAIRNDEWGVWGGTTRKERDYIRRRPNRKREYLQALISSGGTRDVVRLEDENALF